MTLRARLVVALLAMLTVGLAVFGYVTYRLYARSQYDRLDDQLESSVSVAAGLLDEEPDGVFGPPGDDDGDDLDDDDGDDEPDGGHEPRRPESGKPLPGFLSIYVAEIGADGAVADESALPGVDDRPDLPGDISGHNSDATFTTGSVDGSITWRVLVTDQSGGTRLVVAVPTTDVRDALNRLVAIEAVAALGLLTILAVGSWLVLRRGLRPLERMASTAHSITAGDLSPRVEPADERTEIGQLGLALNTMLGRLEAAFDERDRTEARLRQFLADAAHELRTPLTSIQGFAELFRLGPDQDRADLAVSLSRIEEESHRMRTLVDDLLLLARLDQTRPVERVPVDLAVLAAEACGDAAAADPAREISLDAPEPAVVQGDAVHLRRAIDNLVTNALRHTPPGTPIEVAARVDGGHASVTVRDHGDGLDDEALAHVFDRFWQANPSRSEAGAGLGLSIVAGIARAHGGTVTAANARDRDGAVFTLTLPVTGGTPRDERS